MGNSIFKLWPDKTFVQEERIAGSKCREGPFKIKQHFAGLIGSADDIIFSTELGV